jgi:hypothetical protein
MRLPPSQAPLRIILGRLRLQGFIEASCGEEFGRIVLTLAPKMRNRCLKGCIR